MNNEAKKSKKIVTAFARDIVNNLSHDEIDKLCVGLLDANMKTKAWAARERRKAENRNSRGSVKHVQKDAVELLEKGHSITELIELFEDTKELHDIYVNSGLVYPDFEKIVQALMLYRDKQEYDKEIAGRNKMLEELTHVEPAYRLFVDLDGTLAKFVPQDNMDVLYQKGYFLSLPPQMSVINAIKRIIWDCPMIEVFTLSAYLTDSLYAFTEKNLWIERYIPEINDEHRIFVPNGKNKKEYICEISENDYLLDDFTPNLLKWAPGKGIKLLNGINHSKGTWKGDRVSMERDPYELARAIISIVQGEIHIYDEKDRLMDFRPEQKFFPEEENLFY